VWRCTDARRRVPVCVRLEPRQVESVSSSPVPCFPTAFTIFIDSRREGCLPGGIPLSPRGSQSENQRMLRCGRSGATQEPPHALHSLHYALPTFSLWLPPFNPVENY